MTGERRYQQSYIQCKLSYPSIAGFLDEYTENLRYGRLVLSFRNPFPSQTRFKVQLELPLAPQLLTLEAIAEEAVEEGKNILKILDLQAPHFQLMNYYVQLCGALDPRSRVQSDTAIHTESSHGQVLLKFLQETVTLDTQPTHQFEFESPEHFLKAHEQELSKGYLTVYQDPQTEPPALGQKLRVLIHPPFHWFHTTLDAEVVSLSPEAVHFAISVRTKRSRDIIEQYVELCRDLQATLSNPASYEEPIVSSVKLEKEFELPGKIEGTPTRRIGVADYAAARSTPTIQTTPTPEKKPLPHPGYFQGAREKTTVETSKSSLVHGQRLERLRRRQFQSERPVRSVTQDAVGPNVRGTLKSNQERLQRLRKRVPTSAAKPEQDYPPTPSGAEFLAFSKIAGNTESTGSSTPTKELSRQDLPAAISLQSEEVSRVTVPLRYSSPPAEKKDHVSGEMIFGESKEVALEEEPTISPSASFPQVNFFEEQTPEPEREEAGLSVFEQNQQRLRRLAQKRPPTFNDTTVPLRGKYQKEQELFASQTELEQPEVLFEETPQASLSSEQLTPPESPLAEVLDDSTKKKIEGTFALLQSQSKPAAGIRSIQLQQKEADEKNFQETLQNRPSGTFDSSNQVTNRDRLKRLRKTSPHKTKLTDTSYSSPLVASVEVGDLYYHRISFPSVLSFLHEYDNYLKNGHVRMQLSPSPRQDDILIVAVRPPHLGEDYQFQARVLHVENNGWVELELSPGEGRLLDKIHRFAALCQSAYEDLKKPAHSSKPPMMAQASEIDWSSLFRFEQEKMQDKAEVQVCFPSLDSYFKEYHTNILCDGLFLQWEDAPDVGGTVHLLLTPPYSWHSVYFQGKVLVMSPGGIGLSLEKVEESETRVLKQYEELYQHVVDDLQKKTTPTAAAFDSIPAAETISTADTSPTVEAITSEQVETLSSDALSARMVSSSELPSAEEVDVVQSAMGLPTIDIEEAEARQRARELAQNVVQHATQSSSELTSATHEKKGKSHTLEFIPSVEETRKEQSASETGVSHPNTPPSTPSQTSMQQATVQQVVAAPVVEVDVSWDLRPVPNSAPQMEGTLERIDVADLLISLSEQEQTGLLELTLPDNVIQIFLNRGSVTHLFEENPIYGTRFRQILLSSPKLTDDHIDEADWVRKDQNLLLGESLVQLGYITMRELGLLLRKQTRKKLLSILQPSGGNFRFFANAEPGNVKPMPMVRPLKMLFRHYVHSEEVSDLTTQEIERLMAEHLDQFIIPLKNSPEEIYLFGFSEKEQEVWEQLIDGTHTLRNALVLSRLGTSQTHAFVYALQKLRYLTFQDKRPKEIDEQENDTLIFEKSRHLGTNYFDFLELHWTSRAKEIEDAYQRLFKQFADLRETNISEDSNTYLEQILEYCNQAYETLRTLQSRRAYRKKVISPSQIEFMSQLLIQQGDMAIFRRDLHEAMDRYEHSLELSPERSDIERKVLMLRSAIQDGVEDLISQDKLDIEVSN